MDVCVAYESYSCLSVHTESLNQPEILVRKWIGEDSKVTLIYLNLH